MFTTGGVIHTTREVLAPRRCRDAGEERGHSRDLAETSTDVPIPSRHGQGQTHLST